VPNPRGGHTSTNFTLSCGTIAACSPLPVHHATGSVRKNTTSESTSVVTPCQRQFPNVIQADQRLPPHWTYLRRGRTCVRLLGSVIKGGTFTKLRSEARLLGGQGAWVPSETTKPVCIPACGQSRPWRNHRLCLQYFVRSIAWLAIYARCTSLANGSRNPSIALNLVVTTLYEAIYDFLIFCARTLLYPNAYTRNQFSFLSSCSFLQACCQKLRHHEIVFVETLNHLLTSLRVNFVAPVAATSQRGG
jgi:hypothetical protein